MASLHTPAVGSVIDESIYRFDQICWGATSVDGEGRETEEWEDGRWKMEDGEVGKMSLLKLT